MNFGNTTVLNNGKIGETTVLSGDLQQTQAVRPHLLRNKNNEIINLTKPVFRIGKEKSYVDYFVSDNTAVSSFSDDEVGNQNGCACDKP